MVGTFAVAIPKFTKGLLALTPKNKAGQPFGSKPQFTLTAGRPR